MKQADDRKLRIIAIAPNHILYNGRTLSESVLTPGDEFSIGNEFFSVREAKDDYDLHLEITKSTAKQSKELEVALLASVDPGAGKSVFSMRRVAWIISLAIVIMFLLVPLAGFVYKPMGIWLRTLPVVSDLSWSSGTISTAHSFFKADCNRCHEKAFVSVRNSVCTDCHKNTPHHVAKEFQESINSLDSNRCASCHKEHNGSQASALIRHDEVQCTSCHGNLKASAPNTKLADVTDFGDGHPEFQATIFKEDDKSQPVRISLKQKKRLLESANLEFGHAVHLDKAGVKSPSRGNVRLECADCHQPEPGGKYMAKLNFESQCHECHKLKFEADDPTIELPHGDDKRIQTFLDGYYAGRALKGDYQFLTELPVAREPHQPGEELTPLEQTVRKEQVTKHVNSVYTKVMGFPVCGMCHAITKVQGENQQLFWKVEPVRITAHKFPKADFNHDKHKTQDCKNCHDAEKSELSEDVLLKGIASCRECHDGVRAKNNKIASTCVDCHGFHTSPNLTMEGKKSEPRANAETLPDAVSPPPASKNEGSKSAAP
jgi:predicted CXXCH cytochrome family protein